MTLYVIAALLSLLALGVLAIATHTPPRHRCPRRADWLLSLAAAWDLWLRPRVLIGG